MIFMCRQWCFCSLVQWVQSAFQPQSTFQGCCKLVMWLSYDHTSYMYKAISCIFKDSSISASVMSFNFSCFQVHNYMSVRRSSITDLSNYIKTILRSGTPRKGRGWPTIAQLPGDIKNPDHPKFKPNLVAYQVCALSSVTATVCVSAGTDAEIVYKINVLIIRLSFCKNVPPYDSHCCKYM
jgi:hypothetical protein